MLRTVAFLLRLFLELISRLKKINACQLDARAEKSFHSKGNIKMTCLRHNGHVLRHDCHKLLQLILMKKVAGSWSLVGEAL